MKQYVLFFCSLEKLLFMSGNANSSSVCMSESFHGTSLLPSDQSSLCILPSKIDFRLTSSIRVRTVTVHFIGWFYWMNTPPLVMLERDSKQRSNTLVWMNWMNKSSGSLMRICSVCLARHVSPFYSHQKDKKERIVKMTKHNSNRLR